MGFMLEKSTPHSVSLAMKLGFSPLNNMRVVMKKVPCSSAKYKRMASRLVCGVVCCECNQDDWVLFSLRQ